MLNLNRILDAAEAVLQEKSPNATVYRDRTPKDFARPSYLLTLKGFTQEDAAAYLLGKGVTLAITGFPPTDGYSNAKTADLLAMLAMLQLLFSDGLPIADGDDHRVLHVGQISGDYEADYVAVDVPLTWMDQRPSSDREWPLMEDIALNFKAH